jgi:hypothetical protein
MIVELTEAQRQALEERPDEPLRLIDPRTRRAYVLLPADVYARLLAQPEEDELSDTYAAQMESALRAGWDDPAMDDYNNYEENFRKLWP